MMDGHMALCARCGASAGVGAQTDVASDDEAHNVRARLTKKEIRIFRLLQCGLTNKQIANQLFVSDNTVKFHLKNIYEKLGLRSRRRVDIDGLPAHGRGGPRGFELLEGCDSSSCS